MELKNFIHSLKIKQRAFWLIVVGVFLVSFIITIVQPLKFGTESRLMVSQNIAPGADLYTISKSNEYLSNSLARVVTSNAFFNDTMSGDFGIDKSYFSTDLKQQIEQWRKTVEASPLADSGIILINVYHPDHYQAQQIARAINYTLKTKAGSYFNSNSNTFYIRVLDEPVVSTWPIKPNVVTNLLSGLLLGFALALFYVYLVSSDEGELITVLPEREIETTAQPLSTTPVVATPAETKIITPEITTPPAVARPTPVMPDLSAVIVPDQPPVAPEFAREPANTAPTSSEQFEELIKQSDIKNVF
jgi:capsular polysaccharide biosynthesis protein